MRSYIVIKKLRAVDHWVGQQNPGLHKRARMSSFDPGNAPSADPNNSTQVQTNDLSTQQPTGSAPTNNPSQQGMVTIDTTASFPPGSIVAVASLPLAPNQSLVVVWNYQRRPAVIPAAPPTGVEHGSLTISVARDGAGTSVFVDGHRIEQHTVVGQNEFGYVADTTVDRLYLCWYVPTGFFGDHIMTTVMHAAGFPDITGQATVFQTPQGLPSAFQVNDPPINDGWVISNKFPFAVQRGDNKVEFSVD